MKVESDTIEMGAIIPSTVAHIVEAVLKDVIPPMMTNIALAIMQKLPDSVQASQPHDNSVKRMDDRLSRLTSDAADLTKRRDEMKEELDDLKMHMRGAFSTLIDGISATARSESRPRQDSGAMSVSELLSMDTGEPHAAASYTLLVQTAASTTQSTASEVNEQYGFQIGVSICCRPRSSHASRVHCEWCIDRYASRHTLSSLWHQHKQGSRSRRIAGY
jgi:hypothetical protein